MAIEKPTADDLQLHGLPNGTDHLSTAIPAKSQNLFGTIEPGAGGRLEAGVKRTAEPKPLRTIGLHIKGGRGANVDGALIENVHTGVQVENHRNLTLKNVTVRGALIGHLFGGEKQ